MAGVQIHIQHRKLGHLVDFRVAEKTVSEYKHLFQDKIANNMMGNGMNGINLSSPIYLPYV